MPNKNQGIIASKSGRCLLERCCLGTDGSIRTDATAILGDSSLGTPVLPHSQPQVTKMPGIPQQGSAHKYHSALCSVPGTDEGTGTRHRLLTPNLCPSVLLEQVDDMHGTMNLQTLADRACLGGKGKDKRSPILRGPMRRSGPGIQASGLANSRGRGDQSLSILGPGGWQLLIFTTTLRVGSLSPLGSLAARLRAWGHLAAAAGSPSFLDTGVAGAPGTSILTLQVDALIPCPCHLLSIQYSIPRLAPATIQAPEQPPGSSCSSLPTLQNPQVCWALSASTRSGHWPVIWALQQPPWVYGLSVPLPVWLVGRPFSQHIFILLHPLLYGSFTFSL